MKKTLRNMGLFLVSSITTVMLAAPIQMNESEALSHLREELPTAYHGETAEGFFCVVDTFREPAYIPGDHQVIDLYVQNPHTRYFFALMTQGVVKLTQVQIQPLTKSFTTNTEGIKRRLTLTKDEAGNLISVTFYDQAKENYPLLKSTETCEITSVAPTYADDETASTDETDSDD